MMIGTPEASPAPCPRPTLPRDRPFGAATRSVSITPSVPPPAGGTDVGAELTGSSRRGDLPRVCGVSPGDLLDTALVRRAQANDRDAIAELLRRARPVVERTVGRLCVDHQLVGDLTQTSLLIVFTELTALRSPEAFIGWVQGIVRNVCRKEMRRHGCMRAAASRLVQDTLTHSAGRARVVDPEEVAVELEIRAHLQTALATLPIRYRMVVTMRALHGYSYEEISDVLDTPTQLLRLWYFRGRHRLQQVCASDDVLARTMVPGPAPDGALELPGLPPPETTWSWSSELKEAKPAVCEAA